MTVFRIKPYLLVISSGLAWSTVSEAVDSGSQLRRFQDETQRRIQADRPVGSIPSDPAVSPYALLTHAPQAVRPVTSGRFDGSVSMYNLEFIEPGLQHRKVKVYRTNDAAEQIYKDTIPLDKGGFQIIVIGTRNPDYVH